MTTHDNDFFLLHQLLVKGQLLEPEIESGIGENCDTRPTACISERARIGNNVHIGAHVVVHDYVDIGSDSFIDSGAQVGVEGLLKKLLDNSKKRQLLAACASAMVEGLGKKRIANCIWNSSKPEG